MRNPSLLPVTLPLASNTNLTLALIVFVFFLSNDLKPPVCPSFYSYLSIYSRVLECILMIYLYIFLVYEIFVFISTCLSIYLFLLCIPHLISLSQSMPACIYLFMRAFCNQINN